MFKHPNDEDKEECINYRLGFCSLGPLCAYRHIRRSPEQLAPVSDLWKPGSFVEQHARAEAEKAGGAYRVSLCKYYLSLGWCPYFEQCKYAHSTEEIRKYAAMSASLGLGPGGRGRGRPDGFSGGAGGYPGTDSGGFAGRKRGRDEMGGGRPGPGGPPMRGPPVGSAFGTAPDAPDTATALRMMDAEAAALRSQGMPEIGTSGSAAGALVLTVRSTNADNLKHSLRRSEWVTSVAGAAAVEDALRDAAGAGVFLALSIVGSKHYQGVARVRAAPRAWEGAGATGLTVLRRGVAMPPDEVRVIPIEWLRTCALPFATTRNVRNSDTGLLPVCVHDNDWVRLPANTGKALLVLLFQAQYVRVQTDDAAASQPFELLDTRDAAMRDTLAQEDYGTEVSTAMRAPLPPQESGGRSRPSVSPGTSLPSLWLCEQALIGPPPAAPPATPLVGMLLKGMAPPPGTPPPAVIAADCLMAGASGKGAVCVGIPGDLLAVCINRGVFPLLSSAGVQEITAGTPLLVFDSSAADAAASADAASSPPLLGVFVARGAPSHHLAPALTLLSRGSLPPQTLQVAVFAVAEASPMPRLAYAPLLQSLRGPQSALLQPGPLPPQLSHDLLARMVSTCAPRLQSNIAAFLLQMRTARFFPFALATASATAS